MTEVSSRNMVLISLVVYLNVFASLYSEAKGIVTVKIRFKNERMKNRACVQ